MRKIYEILRLLWACNLSMRATARSCRVARSTVKEYQVRARAAGLERFEDVKDLDEVTLEHLLFPPPPAQGTPRPLPSWASVHEEMQRKGVTLQLLWKEYKARHPDDGLQYSRFTDLYREYRGHLDLSLRQVHKAGEKLFVDYCGQTVPVRDPATGEVREAEVFVAVLGASSYTYAEATWSQQLPDWIGSHERAFADFGGVTEVVVPDNLRSGVHSACRYDPRHVLVGRAQREHYGVAVVPTRVRKPKDKAKAEAGVLLVERWIPACLRHREFFSLEELNAAIRELNERLNDRPFRKMSGSRRSRFEALDRPALRPLPTGRFEIAEWDRERVRRDYHVEIDEHYYSVPHQLVARLPRLLEDLRLAHGDGRNPKLMKALGKVDLLVLDDWVLAPLSDADRREILELLEDRYQLRSTLVASQLPQAQWHDALGHPTLADAILDRLVHNAYRIEMQGESIRRRDALDLAGTAGP